MLCFDNKYLKFNADKCCGCTICVGICKEDALSLKYSSNGNVLIEINTAKCTKCGQCVKICPANKFQHEKLNDLYFNKTLGFEIAYSSDEKLRYKSSSGGCTRTIAYYSLKSRIVDTVYTLDCNNDSPSGIYYYPEDANDILQTLNSQYRLVNYGAKIGSDKKSNKRLIIGIPCQIKAVKNFYQLNGITNVYYLALLCKQQKNRKYLKFLKKQYDISDNHSIFFRGSGWPGKTGDNKVQIPYSWIAGIAFGKKLWRINGCKYCGDCMGIDTADLTLADPWGLKEFEDGIGKNLIFIWNEKGLALLENAKESINRTSINKSDALTSIAWSDFKQKIKQINYYNFQFGNSFNAIIFKFREIQRRSYEELLLKIKVRQFVIKILNRLPFIK